TAQEKLSAVASDADTLTKRRSEVVAVQATLAQAKMAAGAAESRMVEIRRQLEEQQAARPQYEIQLAALRTDHERVQLLIKLRQLTVSAAALTWQVAEADAAATEVAALESRRAGLPSLAAVKLRKRQDVAEARRTLRVQVPALGMTVELTPDRDTAATSPDGS